jgi:outer membrane immunogenic protein
MTGLKGQAIKNATKPGLGELCVTDGKSSAGFFSCSLLLAACLFTSSVCADMFFGVKTGPMMVDVSTDKNPINLALNLGYQLDTRIADLSLAGEVNRTLRDGETGRGEDLEFESEAIYLVYRSPRSLFVSLRGGIAWDKVVIDGNSSRDDGLLFGAGFGIVAGKTLIQIEYTSIAGDANFLSLSLEF